MIMKNFTRKKALTYIKRRTKELEKQGYDINYLFKDKTMEQFAWSRKSYNDFNRRVTFLREQRKRQKSVNKNLLTTQTKSILKFNHNIKNPTKNKANKLVKKELMFLYDKYFMELKYSEEGKRVKQLINKFGARLDLAYRFIDFINEQEFKYPIEKDIFKSEFANDYFDEMVDRLNLFEDYVKRDLKL